MSQPQHLPDRAVIRLSGADRKTFLQGLITQDTGALSASAPIFTALLTPQGKILFDFFIVEDGESLLLDCRKEAAPALVKRLTLYKLRAKVTIALDEALHVLAAPTPFETREGAAFADPRCAQMGWRAISADKGSLPDGAYEQRRFSNGVPEFGADFDGDKLFLMDVNYDALNAVSYQKGCFVGQEVASRMKRKGEIRRRTLLIHFEGPALKPGDAVTAGGSTLGAVLGSQAGIALAEIRLDRWEKAKADNKADNIVSAAGEQIVQLSVPDYLK